MRGPLTRRRERRILKALQALGPLKDYELAGFLGTPSFLLEKPLLNLALDHRITASADRHLLGRSLTWSIANQEADHG